MLANLGLLSASVPLGAVDIEGEYWDVGNAWPAPTVHALQRRKCDIHVIASHHNNFLASQANMNRGIEAFRKVDFVFANAYYLKADAQYADIVFPLTTRWENDQASAYCFGKDKEYGFAFALRCAARRAEHIEFNSPSGK